MITVIIPLRLSRDSLYDEVDRLRRIAKSVPRDKFSILIVDFGTGSERVGELTKFKTDHPQIEIIRAGDPNKPFSIGEARDVGVQSAKTPVIMFHDLDFLCETQSYEEIYEEVKLRRMDVSAYDFLCVPTIFLTEKGTENYLAEHNKAKNRNADRFIHNQALRYSRNEYIQHAALGSSALIINRYMYLVSGGHDRSFIGHGAEDFEFYNRLTDLLPRTQRPQNYEKNVSFEDGKWEGFRAFFALYGMDLWMRGIAMVHLNHPRREKVDSSYKKSKENFQILYQKMEGFSQKKEHLPPLRDPYINNKAILLVEPNSTIHKSLRMILPALGSWEVISEKLFNTGEELVDFVNEQKFNCVVFLNPYGNQHRLNLYNFARTEKIKCLAFDRGALTDSWFFDQGGFLGSSESYAAEQWNVDLGTQELNDTEKWISEYIKSEKTLELNGSRKGQDYWRTELGVGNRRVIFVALQRPSDTATRFFAGSCEDYNNFLSWIKEFSQHVDRKRYAILIKQHPLEDNQLDLGDCVKFVPNSAHVYDLIDLCEKVIVLNSGVGLLAMMMKKPVIVCGDAFYNKANLAYQANSMLDLIDLVKRELRVDFQLTTKFIYYLKEKFYSFGYSEYIDKKNEFGSRIRICKKIDFSVIRGICDTSVNLGVKQTSIEDGAFLLRGVSNIVPITKERAKKLFLEGEYLTSANMFEECYKLNRNAPNLLRAAAEGYILAGKKSCALRCLTAAKKVASLSSNKRLSRRIRITKYPVLQIFMGDCKFNVEEL
ncbi:capsular polysaccharide export protein, LipB/KpsS family [Roseibium aggregatum]|uniref:Capsule polysaccharide biosynthesis protein n=1 Tax=Roseibium aggregatum TaxID=187304 RepID=A0A0M6Y9A8_9HYPH|nr:glycosyltransferase [Roseibium aggregatum]CTQ45380.1 Capsule polysaccharide biosynthesis protein [Roseibium aggregatum]